AATPARLAAATPAPAELVVRSRTAPAEPAPAEPAGPTPARPVAPSPAGRVAPPRAERAATAPRAPGAIPRIAGWGRRPAHPASARRRREAWERRSRSSSAAM